MDKTRLQLQAKMVDRNYSKNLKSKFSTLSKASACTFGGSGEEDGTASSYSMEMFLACKPRPDTMMPEALEVAKVRRRGLVGGEAQEGNEKY